MERNKARELGTVINNDEMKLISHFVSWDAVDHSIEKAMSLNTETSRLWAYELKSFKEKFHKKY